eukprot:gb/GFBE01054887.1/.p1 GENE.gb/GFBE01054887.1/~~gb/GFBE01054887.1/.p1  ORF type:complete len:1101 (+),score=187.44 gb/GFBE01054887.1/:1-3303(+)
MLKCAALRGRIRRAATLQIVLVLALLCLQPSEAQVPSNAPGPISFYDHDPDAGKIGGIVEFIKASSEADITGYKVYWGSSPTTKLLPLVDITATGNAPQYDIPLGTTVPVVGGNAATYFLVFSFNGNGEMGTGPSLQFHDRHVPYQGPAGVAFSDADYKHGDVQGTITISRASSESDVTDYVLYWGSSASSYLLYITSLPVATYPLVHPIPAGTSLPLGATHLLAYTMNADGMNEVNVASTSVRDRGLPEHAARSVEFVDSDLGKGEISGLVSIFYAADESLISHYLVYYAQAEQGPTGPLLGSTAATGNNVTVLIPADTAPIPGYSYLYVRSKNSDGVMSQGIGTEIVDRYVPTAVAQSVSFLDEDLLADQLAGTIEITPAVDETDITRYAIYFADLYQQPLSFIAEVSSGFDLPNYTLAAATPLPTGAEYLLVLSGSDDGFMTTGTTAALVDRAVPLNVPSQIQFVDTDMDSAELGGTLTVVRANDESDITAYTAYFGTSAVAVASSIHSLVGEILVSSLPSTSAYAAFAISMHTPAPGGVTHFLAFSKNNLGESQTGVSVEIIDKTINFPTVAVSSAGFHDTDLDMGQIGGSLTWVPPASTAGLTSYTAFLALDSTGTGRQQVCSPVPIGSLSCAIAAGTSLGPGANTFTHVIIYTNNGYGEGPGLALLIVDRALPVAVVTSVAFADMDPDVGSLGGQVTWTPPLHNPTSAVHFTEYTAYLSDGPSGFKGTFLGDAVYGSNAITTPFGHAQSNFTHVLVYTKNSVGEALLAAHTEIVDRYLPQEFVENLGFWDQDLAENEIGGDVSWTEPADTSTIALYRVRMDCPGGVLLTLGDAPVGSTTFSVPFNSPLDNCTAFVVTAVNDVGEAIVNATVAIEDKTVESCPSETSHRFASKRWRIVADTDVTTAWRLRGVRFFGDALCSVRLPAVPSDWPRRPRLAVGEPFSLPPEPRHLHELFGAGEDRYAGGAVWMNDSAVASAEKPWWSSGAPCLKASAVNASTGSEPACAVGFRWESDTAVSTRGRAYGSAGNVVASAKKVHCVELEQSDVTGEYAGEVSLQWYDEQRKVYRHLLRRRATGGIVRLAYQAVLAAECNAR